MINENDMNVYTINKRSRPNTCIQIITNVYDTINCTAAHE